ncbi:MAG: hypothetical protein DHS80DRAFT_33872 [Piptocephalis tieghemiana]|nr:MAG: hypothetical protein DHS80DRAFT_33872 [Piptocephalis tieghemiana]
MILITRSALTLFLAITVLTTNVLTASINQSPSLSRSSSHSSSLSSGGIKYEVHHYSTLTPPQRHAIEKLYFDTHGNDKHVKYKVDDRDEHGKHKIFKHQPCGMYAFDENNEIHGAVMYWKVKHGAKVTLIMGEDKYTLPAASRVLRKEGHFAELDADKYRDKLQCPKVEKRSMIKKVINSMIKPPVKEELVRDIKKNGEFTRLTRWGATLHSVLYGKPCAGEVMEVKENSCEFSCKPVAFRAWLSNHLTLFSNPKDKRT